MEAFEDDSIMEFKIDITEDENKIFQQVHNHRTRYSKYCEGIKIKSISLSQNFRLLALRFLKNPKTNFDLI